jgi:hypothetical protein
MVTKIPREFTDLFRSASVKNKMGDGDRAVVVLELGRFHARALYRYLSKEGAEPVGMSEEPHYSQISILISKLRNVAEEKPGSCSAAFMRYLEKHPQIDTPALIR